MNHALPSYTFSEARIYASSGRLKVQCTLFIFFAFTNEHEKSDFKPSNYPPIAILRLKRIEDLPNSCFELHCRLIALI